jgi:lysophospholipase L1-like esterase
MTHDDRRHTRQTDGSSHNRHAIPIGRKLLYSIVVFVALIGLLEGGARLLFGTLANDPLQSQRRLVDAVGFPTLNQLLVPDSALFWTVRPNVDGWVLSGRVQGSAELSFRVSTDSLGCRRLPAIATPTRRIAFSGDSTTFGVGVDDEQTFSALLQARLSGVQCLNLGVPGYTAYQGRRRLSQFAFSVSPDVVVVTFGFNDDAPWDGLSDLEHSRIASREAWLQRSRLMTALGVFLQRAGRAGGEPGQADGKRPRLSDAEYTAEIRGIVAWCRSHGAAPVFLLWPRRDQLGADELKPKQQVLLNVAATDGLKVVDLRPAFRGLTGQEPFVDVIHASRAGNQVVASALEPVIRGLLAERTGR